MRKHIGIREIFNAKNDLPRLLDEMTNNNIENIIFCDSNIDEEFYNRIVELAELKMIRIYFIPNFKKNKNLENKNFELVNGLPLLRLLKEPLSVSSRKFLKRTFDIVFSLLVIIFLLSWLIPLITIIIRIESKGPIFFKQKRSGLKNESFDCLKFRSMAINKEADSQIATKNDARVTKVGAFLRKTSIDELPQFINVLKGDMSVVGPRPHMLSQTELYSKITKKYMLRHMVKPGITGWAQVMGARGEIFSNKDMEKRIEKDIWYIQNWSFFLDIKIIFLTFYNVIRGDKQAY